MKCFKVLRPGAGDRKHKALHKTGYKYRYLFILCILLVYGLFTFHQQFGQDYVDKSASVSCGQHRAPTCGKCPYHQDTADWMGQPWCHGECKWHNDECLSEDLVRDIADDPETMFTSINVSYAEDKQAGTWVKNQAVKKIRPKSLGIDVEDAKTEKKKTGADIATRDREYDKVSPTLLKQINSSLIQQQEVSCGGHYAPSCDKCPHDINTGKWLGQINCHGECKWLNNECQSEKALEQEIQEQGTETQSDVGSLQNMCISSLQSCDLSCLDWAIVLSTGRSGSTTVQQMLSKLPGMNFYGEEGGLMSDMQHFQGRIEKMANGHNFLSWHGSQDRDVRSVACMTQKLYAERHGQECNYRGCKHGWKEIRYRSAKEIGWLRTVFPSSRIILNYRSTCSDYKDIFGRDCKAIQEMKDSLLNATKDLSNVFHMELEQLNNKTKWRQLTKFLGYDGCEALNVTYSNLKRGVTGKAAAWNPWSCQ